MVAFNNSSSSYWLWNDPLLTATNLSFSMKTVSAEKWSGLKFLILSECFFWSPKLQISHHSEIRQHRFLDRRPKISPHFSQRLSTGNLRPGSRVVWILLLVCVFFFFFLATNLHVTTRMIQFIEAQREFHCKNTERLEDPCLICWSFSRRQVLQIFCHLFLYFARQQDSQFHERIHLVRTTGRSVRILASLTYSSCLAN